MAKKQKVIYVGGGG